MAAVVPLCVAFSQKGNNAMKTYKMTSTEKRQTLTIDLHEERFSGSYATLFKAMQDGSASRSIALKLKHRPDLAAKMSEITKTHDRAKMDELAAELLKLL